MIDRKKFLARRKSGIGGSDVAAILGLSRWRTAYDVWREKTSDELPEDTQNDVLALASYLEAFTADKYAAITGLAIRRRNSEVVNARFPFLKGNVDREIFNDARGVGVLECKALSAFAFKRVQMYGLLNEYVLQMQHYFRCSNGKYRWGAFAILNRDSGELLTFEVMPDEEIGAMIEEKGVEFWTMYVIAKTPPNTAAATADAAQSLPKYDGKIEDFNGNQELAAAIINYNEVKVIADEAAELLAKAKEQITAAIGDHTAVECAGKRIYRICSETRRLDSNRLKNEKPEIYYQYTTTTKSNPTLRIYNINNQ